MIHEGECFGGPFDGKLMQCDGDCFHYPIPERLCDLASRWPPEGGLRKIRVKFGIYLWNGSRWIHQAAPFLEA